MADDKLVEQSIRALADRHKGRIKPEDLVEAARHKSHPCHHLFEWDDEKAGHAYRVDQARSLIRSVKIVVTHEPITLRAPAFMRDPDLPRRESGYIATKKLANDKEAARRAFCDEFARVSASIRRARASAMALGLEEQLERLSAEVDLIVESMARLDDDLAGHA